MGKVVFWIVIVFAVLFLLRLYNVAQQKKRDRRERGDTGAPGGAPDAAKPGEVMVRCVRCGIFLPRSEAQLIGGAVRCRDRACTTHE